MQVQEAVLSADMLLLSFGIMPCFSSYSFLWFAGCPRALLEIHFHILRHWKGKTEQHKTRDPWHVKEISGHESVKSTEVYIHIENQLYRNGVNDEFIVRGATTPKEIAVLLEIGYEYIMTKARAFKEA